ncbi:MAG: lipopolysaccharide biosynthesis protein [Verrucomicrobiota bacterium]|jgi:O-antigen/teichoic acid export membrane protein
MGKQTVRENRPNDHAMPDTKTSSSIARNWLGKASRVISHLRLKPFEQSTEEGRASERHRRILLTAAAAAAAKGMNALTQLASVPLTWPYLGKERFGLWMTLSTFITMLSFADLGIGSGVLNRISEANGRGDRELARRCVSSAFFMLTGIALVLFCVFMGAHEQIDWPRLLKLKSAQSAAEAGPAVMVLAWCFALNLPLGIISRVQLGYQEGFINSTWTAVGNGVGLAGVLTAAYFRAGVPWLVAAMAGAPVVALLLNGIGLFFVRRPWLMPRWRDASFSMVGELLRVGLMFFILQVTAQLSYSADNLIVLGIFDQQAVADYAVVAMIFSLAPKILEMLFMPLWPAYGEAAARGDIAWIKVTLARSLKGGLLLTGCFAVVLVIFGRQILSLWTRHPAHPAFSLLLGFGCWSLLVAWGYAVGTFLSGKGVIKFQAVCAVVLTGVALPAKIVLGAHFGLPGVIWAMVLSYLLCTFVPLSLYIPRLLAGMRQSSRPCSGVVSDGVSQGDSARSGDCAD